MFQAINYPSIYAETIPSFKRMARPFPLVWQLAEREEVMGKGDEKDKKDERDERDKSL
ncbi:hypothetical protein [Paenibacillus sp. FSL H7-0756]|jgi:hypothetical protein|uniref:hypothetical protein n=1 Tax=Paenibacillus sp. FSL H7-0756 TaxID=2954738 RepID=UPI0030FC233F